MNSDNLTPISPAFEWTASSSSTNPAGITSHDVVQRVRKLLKTSKVGHLGTLDPMATGVLLLCIGKATRVGRFLPSSPKEYVGEIRFGFATTTYDREGERTGPEQVLTHGRTEIQAAMSRLTGAFDQKPPVISAKKMGGIPSYKLARRGMALEPIAVSVDVSTFEITSFSAPLAGFRVVCSSGTYVRSLAHDLGQQLGCGAHLDSLRRVRSGDFSIERAVPLEQATAENIVPLEDLLPKLPRIEIEAELSEKSRAAWESVSNGTATRPCVHLQQKRRVPCCRLDRKWLGTS